MCCTVELDLFSLPLILLNISGSRAYNLSDFPYPVGRDIKVSLPSRKDRIASWVNPGEGEIGVAMDFPN